MSTNNFKSTTSYDFTKEDYDFILQLTKIGYVHILSNQVVLIDENAGKRESHHSFSFNNYSSEINKTCDGFILPTNWIIEHISSNETKLSITFKIKHP